jgi:hypothetical protein
LIAVFFLLLGSAASARADSDSGVLNDWEAADRVDRHGWEPRWRNWDQNNRTPADWELHEFFATTKYWGSCGEWLKERITGNFTGTTDEIIQWGAYKWGIDPDIVRAVAVKESYWNQDGEGDWDEWGNSRSHSLIQIRDDVNPATYPLSRESTAFALDYYGATLRFYYDGCADWLGWGYGAGDIWGAVRRLVLGRMVGQRRPMVRGRGSASLLAADLGGLLGNARTWGKVILLAARPAKGRDSCAGRSTAVAFRAATAR